MSVCSTDVLVSFPKSLRIYSGLMTVSTVCGGLAGILAAALLYFFCLKPLLFTRQVSGVLAPPPPCLRCSYLVCFHTPSHQGYIARRLLEPDDHPLIENNQSDGVSESRKEAHRDKVRFDAVKWLYPDPSSSSSLLSPSLIRFISMIMVFHFKTKPRTFPLLRPIKRSDLHTPCPSIHFSTRLLPELAGSQVHALIGQRQGGTLDTLPVHHTDTNTCIHMGRDTLESPEKNPSKHKGNMLAPQRKALECNLAMLAIAPLSRSLFLSGIKVRNA